MFLFCALKHRGAVKIHIYGALGKAGGAALQKRALDFCLSGAVRSQDLIYIPMAMATSGKVGADTVFSWMQNEYSRIYEMIGATSMMLFQNMVRVSGAGFVTESKAEEVSAFWKTRDVYKNIEKALAQTVEGIKSNSKFVDRSRPQSQTPVDMHDLKIIGCFFALVQVEGIQSSARFNLESRNGQQQLVMLTFDRLRGEPPRLTSAKTQSQTC